MSCSELYYSNNMRNCKVDLKDLKLNRDSCGWYLSATYKIDDEDSIRELSIPKIRLNVNPHMVGVSIDTAIWGERKADIGFGWCDVYHDGTRDEVYFTERVLQEKVHEMTLDEIEYQLGYKVKIVNKKDKPKTKTVNKKENSDDDWLRNL